MNFFKAMIGRFTKSKDPFQKEFAERWNRANELYKRGLLKAADDAFMLAMGREKAEYYYRYSYLKNNCKPLTSNESLALTFINPKIAAILYDKIWAGVTYWDINAPVDILTITPGDSACCEFVFSHGSEGNYDISANKVSTVFDNISESNENYLYEIVSNTRSGLHREVTPLFGYKHNFDTVYNHGNKEVLIAAIEKLPFIDERELHWDHVLELRKDIDSIESIRSFVRWADTSLIGKSHGEIKGEIETKYNKYLKVLKSHGLKTKLTYLECIVDLRSKLGGALVGTGLSQLAHQKDFISVALGASVAIGETSVKLAKELIKLKEEAVVQREKYQEIAFLADLKQYN